MRTLRRSIVVAAVLVALGALAGTPAGAQGVVDRTPNISGGWDGAPGVVQFNFLHRFWLVSIPAEDGGEEKVINTPTFLLAYPVLDPLLVGFNYASNANLGGDGEFNEWEFLARWTPLSLDDDAPVQLGLTAAYNQPATSLDGELAVSLPVGPLRLLGVGRVFSEEFLTDDTGWAVGGGVALRVLDNLSISGDAVTLLDRSPGQDVGWGAGIQFHIPTTPHSLSVQATNTRTGSLQGSSWGDGQTRWGFEFTVPITLSRYFGGSSGSSGAAAADPSETAGGGNAEVEMNNQLRFTPATIRISVGETVTWRNTSDLPHTVTADASKAQDPSNVSLPDGAEPFDSGNLDPGEVFRYTFTEPGEYRYFCIPHEAAAMVGTVIVEP